MQCTYGICDECQNSDSCNGEFVPQDNYKRVGE